MFIIQLLIGIYKRPHGNDSYSRLHTSNFFCSTQYSFWLRYVCHCHLAVEHALNGCNESELQLQIVFCHALNNNSYRQIFNCFSLQIESSNWISSFCVNNSQRVSRCFQLHNYPFIMPRKKEWLSINEVILILIFTKIDECFQNHASKQGDIQKLCWQKEVGSCSKIKDTQWAYLVAFQLEVGRWSK